MNTDERKTSHKSLAKKPLSIPNEHCAKHQHSCFKLASVSASSPSPKPLAGIVKDDTTQVN